MAGFARISNYKFHISDIIHSFIVIEIAANKSDIFSMTLRTFTAIEIIPGIAGVLNDFQKQIKLAHDKAKLTRQENIHLTMVFLGTMFQEQVPVVSEAIETISKEFQPFDTMIAGTGFFGSRRSPRIVWAGIKKNADIITSIYNRLADELRKRGFTIEDRPYSPHITLARIQSGYDPEKLLAVLERNRDIDFGPQKIERIVLMNSELRPAGPVYSILGHFGLGR